MNWPFIVVVVFLLSSCASLTHNGRNQVIVVDSRPAGAEIFVKGQLQGVTPALVEIPRGKRVEVEIRHVDFPSQKIPVAANYRWGRSFAGNLIWFGLAPVGWFVDLVKGSCWELQDPIRVELSETGETKPPQFRRLAIAPPQGPDEFLTDEVARRLESEARSRYPEAEVLPYRKTLPTFLEWEYDYDSVPSWSYRTRLLSALKVDRLLESEVSPRGKGEVTVDSRVTAFHTREPEENFKIRLRPEEVPVFMERRWTQKLGGLFRWLPNTVTVDLAGSVPTLKVNQIEVPGEGRYDDSFWGDVFRYLGALGLSHMEKQSERNIWQYRFQFVPALSVSWSDISYPAIAALNNQEFERWYAAVGYGPQFGLKSKYGHTYFQIIPVLAYSQIQFSNGGQDYRLGQGNIAAITEIGYTYFFSDRFVTKFFIRRVNEDADLWAEAMEKTNPVLSQVLIEGVGYNYVGFSFGYHFSVGRNPLKNLFE